jgi:hypothetical protein
MEEISEEIRLTREEVRLSREERQRSREQAERHAELYQQHTELYSDFRQFTRDMIRRVERLGEDQIKTLRALREESRAHTQALLSLIDRMDRLDPGGSSASP